MATVVRQIDRTYDLAAGGTTPPLTGHSPGGGVVLAYVRDQAAAIWRYGPLARRDEPDAAYQMPVATRRARSALRAFGGIIARKATRPLCTELKWRAAALGPTRDTEVLLAPLAAELTAIRPPRSWGQCRTATTEQALPRFTAAPRDRTTGY